MKKIVFTFGRYNPPTTGHAELITYAVKLAQKTGAEHRIYTSQSHDPSKNPLAPRQKMAFLRQIFPGVNFVDDPAMKTAFAICRKLVDEGYEDVTFVVGDDRVAEFRTQLGKYVKPRTAKDFNPKINYPFKKFKVESSGARKPGISGTDLRKAVRKGDFATFAKASAAKDKSLVRQIFNATKSQLKENVEIYETTARDMHKHLTSQGWKLTRTSGSHQVYQHKKSDKSIVIPSHRGDLKKGLYRDVMKRSMVSESMTRKDFDGHLKKFMEFTCNHLGIKDIPTLRYKEPAEQDEQPSFAAYSPSAKEVIIMTKNRHPMDVFRSIAHELVHHKQNEDGKLGKDIAREGSTGSDIENEANSEAGKIMRYFGKENPFYFDMSYVGESKAIILGGTPGSGKDLLLKEAILPYDFTEINADEFHKYELEGNIVVNGTASDFNKISHIKEELENSGYETMMIFVSTSNEASKQRNEERGVKGGRVISEMVRFNKWQDGQHNMERYAELFENYMFVDNSIDLRHADELEINEHTLSKKKLAESVYRFMIGETDYQFERMIGEDYGAGFWGTSELTDKYKKDTPGETPGGFAPMKVLSFKEKMRDVATTVPSKAKAAPMPSLPIGADRIGDEYGFPKGPSFGDNQTIDQTGVSAIMDPIARWMVKEETKKRFKAKYGALAEQKIREMGAKLAKEAYGDAFYNMTAMANATGGPAEDQDLISNKSNDQADAEKQSIFGFNAFKRNRKLNTKKK